jgi:hypothetical protein
MITDMFGKVAPAPPDNFLKIDILSVTIKDERPV